jgi:nitrogen fixation/metabolism regulation signal transduction histidine kinase
VTPVNSSKNKKSFVPTKFYKRRWIVNYKVQYMLIGYSLFLIFAVVGSQYLFQLLAFQKGTLESENYDVLQLIITLSVMTMFLIILFYGFNLTNRVVGPIFSLKKHMDAVNQGKDIPSFQIRKNDYFAEIVQPYNELVEKTKKQRID